MSFSLVLHHYSRIGGSSEAVIDGFSSLEQAEEEGKRLTYATSAADAQHFSSYVVVKVE